MTAQANRSTSMKRHGRSLTLLTVGSLTALSVLAGPTDTAEATYYSGGMGNASWATNYGGYNSTYMNPMNASLAAWNATSSPANIVNYGGAPNTTTVGSYAEGWYGYYVPQGSVSYRTNYIRLNSRTISRDNVNAYNFIRSVFVHELGHGLSLNDDPPVSGTSSIMRSDRNRNSMISPQPYDVNDVNAFY